MKKRLLAVAASLGLVGLAIGAWVYQSLAHFSIPVTAAQTDAMLTAFKGSLGEAIFGNAKPQPVAVNEGTGLDALLAPSPAAQSEGLIAAYQKDPAKFKKYALLFDTALNAKRVGQFVQANRSAYALPLSTSALPLGDQKLDAWGHPYCVTATKAGLAVVSRGEQTASLDCKRDIPAKEIAAATRQVFQTTGGTVVVLMSEGDVPSRN